MNPKLMWIQAGFLVAALVIAASTRAYVVSLVLAGVLLAWWLVLNAGYARALDGRARSPVRQTRDRWVALQSLLSVVGGFAAGSVAAAVEGARLDGVPSVSVAFAALAVLACVIYASSLVDWYYVRPRLDGVTRRPPSMTSRERVWGIVTRLWFLHRSLAELLGVLAVVTAAAALVVATVAGDEPSSTTALAAGAAALGVLAIVAQSAVHTMRHYAITEPSVWIGDVLRDGGGVTRYVLHVTIRSYVVREWDPAAADWGAPYELSLKQLEEGRFTIAPLAGEHDCSRLNPDCEWDAERQQRRGARRPLVV